MKSFVKKLKTNKILKRLSSIKITVVCLTLLFILTYWGTVAQVENGLYQSQERFFNSWYFLALGFIPFPGAQLVLWVLFVNLVSTSITRFVYKWSHAGIVTIHIGLLTYFIAAFLTLHCVEESNITLMEGDIKNVSSAYHDWELSVWEETGNTAKEVYAYDTKNIGAGDNFKFDDLGINVVVTSYYPNAQAYTSKENIHQEKFINASGIKSLERMKPQIELEKNIPGGILEVTSNQNTSTILLFGAEVKPTSVTANNRTLNFQLRRKRYEIPISLKLDEFEMEIHPGTEIARSYQSHVEVIHDHLKRKKLIYMNEPLRYKNYTFYQAAYSIDGMGRELSTLAVVKNTGRLLPYVSCFIVFGGLVIHFFLMGLIRKK